MTNRKMTRLETPLVLTGFSNAVRESKFGGFRIDLYLDSNDVEQAAFLDELRQIHSANMAFEENTNGAKSTRDLKLMEISERDPDIVQGTDGLVKLTLKSSYSPKLYDAKGTEISLNHEIPVGSIVRAKVTAGSYTFGGTAGTSLYLNALQISEMPERKEKASSGAGFGSVDGNFLGVGSNTDLSLD